MQELSGNNFTKSTRLRTIMHSLLCSGAQDRDLRPPTRSGAPHGMPPPRVAAANFSFILSWLFFKESVGRMKNDYFSFFRFIKKSVDNVEITETLF